MRTWHILAIGAAVGLSSLLLVPVEQFLPLAAPPLVIRALALIQPAILTAGAIVVGSVLAPRVGLSAPLIGAGVAGRPLGPVLRRQLLPAIVAGVAIAGILVAYGILVVPHMAGTSALAAKLAAFRIPVATRILYGGIVEEILTRWGLMSLLFWIGWRLAGRPADLPRAAGWTAVTVAALSFGLGHLPILSAIVAQPPAWLIGVVILGNTVPGMVFGWLFWRRGLEAAMLAHALAHAIAAFVA